MKPDGQPSTSSNRCRKIIWFNSPYSQNVETNIGKRFFKLVLKNFPKNHRFKKTFNLNTLNLPKANLQSLIKQHNSKVLMDAKKPARLCNCRYKDSSPLADKCLAKSTVYRAEVTTTDKRKL